MDFTMQIDTTNSRKRCRDEPSLAELHMPSAKKARQSDIDASPRDPASPSDSSESGPSTPASIDVDMMEDEFRAPVEVKPQPQPLPQVQVQPRQQGTIISGWNQAQRDRYLRQGYPLSWMQGTRN